MYSIDSCICRVELKTDMVTENYRTLSHVSDEMWSPIWGPEV